MNSGSSSQVLPQLNPLDHVVLLEILVIAYLVEVILDVAITKDLSPIRHDEQLLIIVVNLWLKHGLIMTIESAMEVEDHVDSPFKGIFLIVHTKRPGILLSFEHPLEVS